MEYEVTFVTGPVSDEQEDALEKALGAFVGGHGDVVLVTASAEATDGVAAAKALTTELRKVGVSVRRVHSDLVNIGQIAKRAGVTRQAVSHWVKGRRKTNFPSCHLLAGGGVWRWEEVNLWLAAAGHKHDEMHFLTAQEETIVDYWLYVHRNASWQKTEIQIVQVAAGALGRVEVAWSQEDLAVATREAKRGDFVLA